MISFAIYKVLGDKIVRWSTITAPYHAKPQDLRNEFIQRYPNINFIFVRLSRVEKA